MKIYSLVFLALVGVGVAVPVVAEDGGEMVVREAGDAGEVEVSAVIASDVVTNNHIPAKDLFQDDVLAGDMTAEYISTPDRTTPSNLYRMHTTFSEFCDHNVLKARGWLGNGNVRFDLTHNPTQTTKITLHPGLDMLVGPYHFGEHAFAFAYDGCAWTSKGGVPCGWCEQAGWSLGELNCETGMPAIQRLTYATCYFVDNHMGGQGASTDAFTTASSVVEDIGVVVPRGLPQHSEMSNSSAFANVTFELVSATTTPLPTLSPTNTTGNDISVQASTVLLQPAVIQTRSPEPQNSIILPFHLQLRETCIRGTRAAAAIYANGNMAISLDLAPGLVNSVAHRVPGYANLEIGPFDYATGSVRFGYAGCVWWDFETWRSCGECRAGLWRGQLGDCEREGGGRVKEMDCSVLLGQ